MRQNSIYLAQNKLTYLLLVAQFFKNHLRDITAFLDLQTIYHKKSYIYIKLTSALIIADHARNTSN